MTSTNFPTRQLMPVPISIFGHGPHVTRAVEVYKNRFIAYSLGNFCTYGGINVAGINGWAPIIKVYTNQRQYQSADHAYVRNLARQGENRHRQPCDYQDPGAYKKRFPEVPVRIDDKGLITYLAQQDGL